jgi:hypothetical protein
MNIKQKIVAGLGTVALSIGAGSLAATAPAQAAPASANAVTVIILYKDANNPQAEYPSSYPRNTCINVAGLDTEFIENDTPVEWYVFHTTTCNGSHAVINADPGQFLVTPIGYGGGSIHGLMRTSTVD